MCSHSNGKDRTESKPIIAVTMGDAAGVGPELCLRLLTSRKLPGRAIPLVIGNAVVLERVARAQGLKLPPRVPCFTAVPESLSRPALLDPPDALDGSAVVPGKNRSACGKAAARYITEAVRGCLERRFAALVTAPISKKALNMAGVAFPGHTEMLAALTHTQSYAMLMYSRDISCAFVTCHRSLRSVPESVTAERVVEVAKLAWDNVAILRGRPPRLCLLGLNPHAGEGGLFGDEERRVLLPAMKALARRGIVLEGPLPPDTAFTPQARKRFDCFIAQYHDQGCIPFKMLAFDSGVNITLGLPLIRTSPDHGTAFDIAWQGKVRPDSFFSAYELAVRLAENST